MSKISMILSLLLSVGFVFGAGIGNAKTTQHKASVAAKQNNQFGKSSKQVAARKQVTRKQSQKLAAQEYFGVNSNLILNSSAAMVLDQSTGAVLFEKNANAVLPIASITKLMTAMVALDAQPDLDDILTVSEADVDTLKGTHSRLKVGTQLTREEMLRLALMSSENRAASALSRHYPGGRGAFLAAMNHKARTLGLQDTHFYDPTGLNASNVSSARDLTRMVSAAQRYPLIRQYSTTTEAEVDVDGRTQVFRNTNSLVKSPAWEIGLSKTGYISEAGRCLVMQAWLNNKPTIIVLLDSLGKMTRLGDANRIKHWVENTSGNRHAAG